MPLRLKSLELHGYKTFATRTVFEFANGITAIVGPNGAGKSNIADALRWVLGEQSYSLLRGKKTEDMIFSGSEYRPRAGMASAEIIFDNTENWLPLDYAEVAMTRRAYRDGRNDYLLNAQHVRLRDMNELLAAAGLSERTYTIVGQGLVDASLALKADERRRLFEEAAGVGLYRVRREEATKRLESTERNLERVQDIMAEIEPRLKTLERQARRAKEYAASQADLREVLRQWYGYHWHKAQQELQEAQDHVRTSQVKVQAARAERERLQADYSTFRGRLAELRSHLTTWHREAAALHQERESVNLALAVLDERRRTLTASQAALAAEQQAVAGREQLAGERSAEIDQEMLRAKNGYEEASSQLALAQQALQARQTGRVSVEAALQAARDRVAGLNVHRTETQARRDTLQAQLVFHRERLDSASSTIGSVAGDLRVAEESLAQAASQRREAEKLVSESQRELEAIRKRMADKEQLRRAELETHGNLQARHSRLQAQIEVLEEAERTLTGYADGARFLLDAARQSRLKARGALSALLDLPADLEPAIAAALGDAVDTVLLDPSEVEGALDLLETAEVGRAVLLPLNGKGGNGITPPGDHDLLGIASQLVKAPPDLRAAVDVLLGSTLVVRTRAAAKRLLPSLPLHARIVTLGGAVFHGDGLITAGKGTSPATLSRPRQKRELLASLDEVSAQLQIANDKTDQLARELRSLGDQLSTRESEVNLRTERLQQLKTSENTASLDVEKQRGLLDWHKSRHAEIVREMTTAEADMQKLTALMDEHAAESDQAMVEVRRLSEELSQLGLEEVQERVAYWGTRAAVTEQTVSDIEVRKAEREDATARLAKEVQDLQSQLASNGEALRHLEEEKATLLNREGNLQAKIAALQAKIAPAEKELETTEKEEPGLEERDGAAQRTTTTAEHTLTQFEIDLVRRQEALDSLRMRIVDDFGLVSFEYASNVEGPVPLPFEGLVEELPHVTTVSPDLEDQVVQRRARLRRLGLINPEAAKEYDAESERYSFLSAQVQDMRQAEGDLRQVIAELDELTRQEFSRTYMAVDRQFREIFTRLFGGGVAHLSLTDPENLVETGIEIEARLPGRREQGLSLLSGGERSLTAIALVFALLKVSPTPVCVMDEVDAMLDEANVGRFRDLLKELSQETQFIIITHNRNTVQAADYIYGVTMGRDSTSQIISLRLDEVSEEMLGANRS